MTTSSLRLTRACAPPRCAARYAAASHQGRDAPAERAAFERAAAEVARLQRGLPRLWRGTPIPPGPIADDLKWMCWNAAWHAANERAGRAADARRARQAHEEHAARLARQLAPEVRGLLARSCPHQRSPRDTWRQLRPPRICTG